MNTVSMDLLHQGNVIHIVADVPETMGRYDMVFAPLDYADGIAAAGFPVAVAIINWGTSYVFNFDNVPFHPSYIAEKLCRDNQADGEAVAEVINGLAS